MPLDLAARQRAFVDAILQRRSELPAGLHGHLRAYRGNAQALSASALGGTFPQLREALGEDDFDPMAWTFWRRHPPEQGDLAEWGGALADFLAAQPGMDEALCDLARLEWALHQAERAADTELDAASLALLDQDPAAVRLRLRPGTALLQRGVLVWRKDWRAESTVLDAGAAALMAQLLNGSSLSAALDAALAADADFDFSAWLQAALTQGWLRGAEAHAITGDETP